MVDSVNRKEFDEQGDRKRPPVRFGGAKSFG